METNDYSLFKQLPNARPINQKRVEKLMYWIVSHEIENPKIVVNKRFEILDGYHRLEACKKLGLPIPYEFEKEMKPSNFKKASPMGSVLRKSEAETVASNIMTILSRTGDEWRKLTYYEYKEQRLKDGNYSSDEKKHFEQVIDYCINPDTAKLFAPGWRAVAE